MRLFFFIALCFAGCAYERKPKAHVPAGYVVSGHCVMEGMDRNEKATLLTCKADDGSVTVWKPQ